MAKKKAKRVSRALVGPLGVKGLLFGTAVLAIAKYLARKFLPIPPGYMQGAAMIGASFVPVGGAKILRPAGVVDLASEAVVDLVSPGGLYTVPGLGATNQGGYDF